MPAYPACSWPGLAAMQGEMSAMFLRHEGFLGAVGAFLKVHPLSPAALQNHTTKEPRKVRLASTPSSFC